MPIEIRELVIKATIGDTSDQAIHDGSDPSHYRENLSEERLIKKVVEKVMELIKTRRTR